MLIDRLRFRRRFRCRTTPDQHLFVRDCAHHSTLFIRFLNQSLFRSVHLEKLPVVLTFSPFKIAILVRVRGYPLRTTTSQRVIPPRAMNHDEAPFAAQCRRHRIEMTTRCIPYLVCSKRNRKRGTNVDHLPGMAAKTPTWEHMRLC